MSFIEKLKQPFILAFIVLLVYLSPNIFFPHHARYLIHDNLNTNIVWYKILAESGLMFGPNLSIIPNICWGIPRGAMPSQLNVNSLYYVFFSTLTAYNLNIIAIHVIAFIGMYKLLTDYIFKKSFPYHAAFIALSFAILPFWPSGGLSVAGQPLVVWAFLNILNKKPVFRNCLIICFYPFYSGLVFSDLFFSTGLFVFIMIYFIMNKKVNYTAIIAWFLFIVCMFIPEYRLLYMQFVNHFSSDRDIYFLHILNFKGLIGMSLLLFLKGHYHFYSLQYPILVFTTFISLLFIRSSKQRLLIGLLLFAAYACAFADFFHKWKDMQPLFDKLGELKYVQFRFTCMIPLLWHLAFSLCICYILLRYKKLAPVALTVIIVNVFLVLFNINYRDSAGSNYVENSFYYTYFDKADPLSNQSFHDYYETSFFDEVKNKIKYSHEIVHCIGFMPEIAQYNDIYTTTSIYTYLPKDKSYFTMAFLQPNQKTVVENGNGKTPGNTPEIHYYYDSASSAKIKKFESDTAMHRLRPIRYVFSYYNIDNYHDVGFDSIGYVKNTGSGPIRQIYIYKINSNKI
ncbi:MAG: DUF6044 family protein [Bacteroidia bacterium]